MEYYSRNLTITEEVVAIYAELTDDFNPIHMDQDFAMKTAMGGRIAHGTLSMGLIWEALACVPGFDSSLASLDIRFVKPVRLGSVVRAGVRAAGGAEFEVWVKNEKGEPVISGSAKGNSSQ